MRHGHRYDVRARRGLGWTLLVLGLVGGLMWSVVVQAAMPSWFDPGESCAHEFGMDTYATVKKRVFPPGATCVFTDVPGQSAPVVREFLSPDLSAFFTMTAVVVVLMTVVGIALVAWRLLTRDPAAKRAPIPMPREKKLGALIHALGAAVLGGLVMLVGSRLVVTAMVIGGSPGTLVSIVGIVVVAVALAIRLDAAVGTGYGDQVSARRRGFAVGGLGCAGAIALGAASGIHVGSTWTALLAGVPFAAIAALQWVDVGSLAVLRSK